MIYIILIAEFFKAGLFAIGGGLATIPFLMDMAKRYDFLTLKELTNMIAISESTPGPMGVNTATYVGFNIAGIPGSILATFSLVLPSYIVICVISYFFQKYRDSKYVQGAFIGVRPVVSSVILSAIISILKETLLIVSKNGVKINYIAVLITIIFVILMYLPKLKKIHPLFWIVSGATIGIIFKL